MILKSITKRAAEGLKENLKLMANVRRKEVEAARAQVMEADLRSGAPGRNQPRRED